MEYLINLGMLVVSPILLLSVILLVLIAFRQQLPSKVRQYKYKTYLGLVLGVLVWGMTQSTITYKHTTDYNKQQDVYNIERQQESVSGTPEIVDKTLKPKSTDESRKQSFNEAIKYN